MNSFFTYFIILVSALQLAAQEKQEIFFADVTIYVEGGKYYLTGTNGNRGGPSGFAVLESKDLKTWRVPENANDTLGMIMTRGDHTYGTRGFWAPQIFKANGTFYLTYTANEQTALAESKSLLGPYRQKDIAPIDSSEKNIDSFIFKDDDGKYYLYHVRFNEGNYLWVAGFDLEKGKIRPGTLKKCFDQTEPWEATPNYKSVPIMEGPTVIKLKGKYYLFYSANHFMNIDYAVGYAVSDSPYGPWIKQNDSPIIHRSVVGENGTGHGDIFEGLDGQLYYVYHIHFSQSQVSPRRTRIVPLKKDWDPQKGLYRFSVKGNEVIVPVLAGNEFVRYSDFGARGDGKTDDIEAIVAAHAFANQHNLPVKADDGAVYYISGKDRTAVIQTNTDFGTAAFRIDDTNVQNRNANVFLVSSRLQPFKPEGINSLKRNQDKINVTLPGTCIVTVTNSNVKRYIRFGPNQNNGSSQADIFIADKAGKVDMKAPIIWDFDQITDITALPIDETSLTITGGHFTTIANNAESKYNYYNRGIAVRRSNVIINGMEHRITGEGEHGAPYNGFISISECSYVTVRNCNLTGHKTYQTIGSAGVSVSMGSYDITPNRALNVSFVNCKQTNDINDSRYWGILGSNYCKNIVYDSCTFSRFDAHMGVANATIRNSTLGHQGINAIGCGTFTVENSTIYGRNLVNLRSDYGSTWQGEMLIRNCVFVPGNGRATSANLIGGSNSGQHDFGYKCYMPERITIENLQIDDSKLPADYKGPAIFENFNSKMTDDSYIEMFPYIRTREVILRNVTTVSGKKLRVSDNPFMFKDVKVNSY